MAAQQVLFAEAIIGMKKALARGDDASESDDSIKRTTNRGNKLKRKAKFVQERHLNLADGPKTYRRKINYNGFERTLISRNPPRVDPDGDVIDDDDADSNLNLTDAEDDPYSEIRVEDILRPLTSAADLDKHPSLSLPYNQKNLDEMVHNAEEMLHRERHALWKLKRLQTQFQGDPTWIPCGAFDSEADIFNFLQPQQTLSGPPSTITQDFEAIHKQVSNESQLQANSSWKTAKSTDTDMRDTFEAVPSASADIGPQPNGERQIEAITETHTVDENSSLDQQGNTAEKPENGHNTKEVDKTLSGTVDTPTEDVVKEEQKDMPNGDFAGGKPTADAADTQESQAMIQNEPSASIENGLADTNTSATQASIPNSAAAETGPLDPIKEFQTQEENGEAHGEEEANPPHRMTTRAKAQAEDPEFDNSTRISSPTPSLSTAMNLSYPATHPFFMAPLHGFHDRDFGLPSDLADDIRGMLNLYIQKQEEVVRQANQLYNGLQKAMRLRNNVLEWCRAEGHVGEMSDGEDWIDGERWGFEEGELLKKGEEIDDEEIIATGKKTRRRTAHDR